MFLSSRRLHQIAADVVVERRKSAGGRMPPRVALDRSHALRVARGQYPYPLPGRSAHAARQSISSRASDQGTKALARTARTARRQLWFPHPSGRRYDTRKTVTSADRVE